MLRRLARIARELNWARRRWSTASDQAFHEDLYRHDDYDPFSPAYPGYLTIRRFADLVEPHLPPHGFVLDLGCGPGEITCELAARRRDLTFLGVDHSAAAIAKALGNVSRRRLANIRFERANVEEYTPPGDVHLATLFDAFHHLTDPGRFVNRLQPQVKRWVLIEPRGSWAGTWQKDLDFDWLAQDLDKVRARIAANLNLREQRAESKEQDALSSQLSALPPSAAGEAVERRYTLDDFGRFFHGLALDLRGTVAGLESYPPGARAVDPVRERFGELQYQLYRDIDAWLFERDLDLHAKHWLIVAERGGRTRNVVLSRAAGGHPSNARVAGAFDVRYGDYDGPREATPGEQIMATVSITNDGWDEWSSAVDPAVFVSYHWLDQHGRVVLFDGERTPLPRVVAPGSTCRASIAARAPATPGRYRFAIDLVREGVTWFSQAGHPCLEIPFRVTPR